VSPGEKSAELDPNPKFKKKIQEFPLVCPFVEIASTVELITGDFTYRHWYSFFSRLNSLTGPRVPHYRGFTITFKTQHTR
jgi:hypothetical protein